MLNKKLKIINKLGLHARAAAKLVAHSSRFLCDIKIKKDDKIVNGKSIMGVMLLAASQGSEIEISVDGPDENDALLDLENLINNRFDEAE